jgi:hypothetical protein
MSSLQLYTLFQGSIWISHYTPIYALVSQMGCFRPNFWALISHFPVYAAGLSRLIIALITPTQSLSEKYKLWSCSVCNFLQLPVTSTFYGPYIFPSTLFSNTHNLWFSSWVRDEFLNPIWNNRYNFGLCILIFRQDKRFFTPNCSKHIQNVMRS